MSRCTECGASGREPQHLMLTRPRDRRVEQAGDADPVWQSIFDGGFDEAWREESQRYRHADVALATRLPCGDAVDRRGTGLDFGQPLPSPRDCANELEPALRAHRTSFGSW